MTDRDLIEKYMNKNTSVSYDMYEECFVYTDAISKIELKYDEYIKYHTLIFGEALKDECIKWVDKKIKVITKEVTKELEKYHLFLGRREWEIQDNTNLSLDFETFSKHLQSLLPNTDKSLILKVCDEWFSRRVLEESKKIMDID